LKKKKKNSQGYYLWGFFWNGLADFL